MLLGVTQNKVEAKMYYRRGPEKMAAPAEQVKLGVGGFKLEDSNYKPQLNPQVPYQARDDQVIDCFKAAEKYRGVLVGDHRPREKKPIDCYEAAKKYGGILIVDNPAEKYGGQLKYPATKAPPRTPLTQE